MFKYMLLKQTKMKFPKVSSVPIVQLPTDSSVLTAQEKYIFDTIFIPEVNEFERSSQAHELMTQKAKETLESHSKQEKETKNCHSFGKKFIISILLTAIVIIFAISPIPSLVRKSTTSPIMISALIFSLIAVSFLFLQPYINI